MIRGVYRGLTAAVVLASLVASPAVARDRDRPDHPKLRAALHELREARAELMKAPDGWPPGDKERTLTSIDAVIRAVKTILAVKDVDTFRGVDRDQDYYKRYPNYSHMRAALEDMRAAREELRAAKADSALDDVDVAVGNLITLLRHNRR